MNLKVRRRGGTPLKKPGPKGKTRPLVLEGSGSRPSGIQFVVARLAERPSITCNEEDGLRQLISPLGPFFRKISFYHVLVIDPPAECLRAAPDLPLGNDSLPNFWADVVYSAFFPHVPAKSGPRRLAESLFPSSAPQALAYHLDFDL